MKARAIKFLNRRHISSQYVVWADNNRSFYLEDLLVKFAARETSFHGGDESSVPMVEVVPKENSVGSGGASRLEGAGNDHSQFANSESVTKHRYLSTSTDEMESLEGAE